MVPPIPICPNIYCVIVNINCSFIGPQRSFFRWLVNYSSKQQTCHFPLSLNRIKKTCRLLLCRLCSNNIFLCILCCLNEIGNTGLVTIQRTRLIIFSLWKRSIVLSFAFFLRCRTLYVTSYSTSSMSRGHFTISLSKYEGKLIRNKLIMSIHL